MRAIRIIDLPPRRGSLLCEFGAVAGITAISLMVVMYRYRQRRQRECVRRCWCMAGVPDVFPGKP